MISFLTAVKLFSSKVTVREPSRIRIISYPHASDKTCHIWDVYDRGDETQMETHKCLLDGLHYGLNHAKELSSLQNLQKFYD